MSLATGFARSVASLMTCHTPRKRVDALGKRPGDDVHSGRQMHGHGPTTRPRSTLRDGVSQRLRPHVQLPAAPKMLAPPRIAVSVAPAWPPCRSNEPVQVTKELDLSQACRQLGCCGRRRPRCCGRGVREWRGDPGRAAQGRTHRSPPGVPGVRRGTAGVVSGNPRAAAHAAARFLRRPMTRTVRAAVVCHQLTAGVVTWTRLAGTARREYGPVVPFGYGPFTERSSPVRIRRRGHASGWTPRSTCGRERGEPRAGPTPQVTQR